MLPLSNIPGLETLVSSYPLCFLAAKMAVRSRLFSQPCGSIVPTLFLVALLLISTDGAPNVSSGPTAEEKLQKMTELFRYLLDKDIPRFQAGFTDDAVYKYAGGPGLPYTGPFKVSWRTVPLNQLATHCYDQSSVQAGRIQPQCRNRDLYISQN